MARAMVLLLVSLCLEGSAVAALGADESLAILPGKFTLNGSAVNLNLPPGSAVLYAELIWSGSYSYGGEDVSAFLNNSVTFTTPGGTTFTVAPERPTERVGRVSR